MQNEEPVVKRQSHGSCQSVASVSGGCPHMGYGLPAIPGPRLGRPISRKPPPAAGAAGRLPLLAIVSVPLRAGLASSKLAFASNAGSCRTASRCASSELDFPIADALVAFSSPVLAIEISNPVAVFRTVPRMCRKAQSRTCFIFPPSAPPRPQGTIGSPRNKLTASFISLCTCLSEGLGVGSPLGWLCDTISCIAPLGISARISAGVTGIESMFPTFNTLSARNTCFSPRLPTRATPSIRKRAKSFSVVTPLSNPPRPRPRRPTAWRRRPNATPKPPLPAPLKPTAKSSSRSASAWSAGPTTWSWPPKRNWPTPRRRSKP